MTATLRALGSPPVWNPPLLPKSRLRRGPLVPFVAEGLRTGGCLFPVWWGKEPTFLLTESQYERLKRVASTPTSTEKAEVDESGGLLVEADEFAEYQRIHRPDVLSDRAWATSHDEPFNPEEWIVVPLSCGRCPVEPQNIPPPLTWDSSINPQDPEIYPLFPHEYYSSLIRPQFIPNLRKKTAAKTVKGVSRFIEKMEPLWADRKALFDLWRGLVPYNPHQSESFGELETPLHCARCGASVFTEKIVCKDCGKSMRRFVREHKTLAEERAHDPAVESETLNVLTKKKRRGSRRKRIKIAVDLLVKGLLASRQEVLIQLLSKKELTKAANTMRLLTEKLDLMSKDIAKETDESTSTIDSRCTRILAALEKFTRDNRPLPTVHPANAALFALVYPEIFVKVCPQYEGDPMKLIDALLDGQNPNNGGAL